MKAILVKLLQHKMYNLQKVQFAEFGSLLSKSFTLENSYIDKKRNLEKLQIALDYKFHVNSRIISKRRSLCCLRKRKVLSNIKNPYVVYRCHECNLRCKDRLELECHLPYHSSENIYRCFLCSFSAKQLHDLKIHFSRMHTGERPYKCTVCDYGTVTSFLLRQHIKNHSAKKACPHCDYRSNRTSDMTRHIRTHTGENPFKCTECEYASNDSSSFRRHMRIHNGEKPYKCTQCDYACKVSSQLDTHMRKHTGEKPFKCTQCYYAGARAIDLRNHMRTHTGEKTSNYQCNYVSVIKQAVF